MSARVEMRLSGCLDHLRLVWQAGETILETVPFVDDPEGTRYNVLVALQEMLTNIYRHGYRGDETRPVDVELSADAGGFAVTLRDRGPRFDPRTVSTPPVSDNAIPAEGGGFGIMIARAVMDSFDYAFVEGCNVVTMTKGVVARRAVGAGSAAS